MPITFIRPAHGQLPTETLTAQAGLARFDSLLINPQSPPSQSSSRHLQIHSGHPELTGSRDTHPVSQEQGITGNLLAGDDDILVDWEDEDSEEVHDAAEFARLLQRAEQLRDVGLQDTSSGEEKGLNDLPVPITNETLGMKRVESIAPPENLPLDRR